MYRGSERAAALLDDGRIRFNEAPAHMYRGSRIGGTRFRLGATCFNEAPAHMYRGSIPAAIETTEQIWLQ